MKLATLIFLVTGAVSSVLAYRDGDKIYALASDKDLGHGTGIFEGIQYAFEAPPSHEHWYISNSNGTEAPHWKYLPNLKASADASLGSVPADAGVSVEVAGLEERQSPPSYINYYNAYNCQDFSAQNKPVTLNQCVYNNANVAWSSSFTPTGSTCRFIVNYYNSGCGPHASCSGYITQTLDYKGCFNPSNVFCSTFARCCLSGC